MRCTDEKKLAMLAALEKTLGVVTKACRNVNISRETHYAWMKTDPEYRKAVKDVENISLDFVESALYAGIAKGNPVLIIFYLKCRGKKRGYIEDNDVTIKGNMKFKADFGESNPIHTTSESEKDS